MSTKRRWWILPAALVAGFMIRVAVQEPSAPAVEAAFATFGDDQFAVGEDGVILHSSDGGKSWFYQQSGTDEDLDKVWGNGAGDVYVSGEDGVILHTSDRGASWIRVDEDDNS